MTSTSVSCRMTWCQFCPNSFYFFRWLNQICIYYFLQQRGSLIFYCTHCMCIPLQNRQWAVFIPSGCAQQIKGKRCVVMPSALCRADLQHFTPHHGWILETAGSDCFLNHLLAGVITAAALSQIGEEAAHHSHPLNVQFIKKRKKREKVCMLLMSVSFCGGTRL